MDTTSFRINANILALEARDWENWPHRSLKSPQSEGLLRPRFELIPIDSFRLDTSNPMLKIYEEASAEVMAEIKNTVESEGYLVPMEVVDVCGENTFFLWSGLRRLLALKKSSVKSLPVVIRTIYGAPSNIAGKMLFLRTRINSATRALTTIEKVSLARQYASFLRNERRADEATKKLLGEFASEEQSKSLSMLLEVSPEIFLAEAKGEISSQELIHIAQSSSESRELLFRLYLKVSFSYQQQRFFRKTIRQLCAINGCSATTYYAQVLDWISSRVQKQDREVLGKADSRDLLRFLESMRYPQLVAHRAEIDNILKSTSIPEGVRIRIDNSFESTDLELTCHITSVPKFDEMKEGINSSHFAAMIRRLFENL